MKKLFGQIPFQLIIMMITMIGVITIALTSVYPDLKWYFPYKQRQESQLARIDFRQSPFTLSPGPDSTFRTVEFKRYPDEANLEDLTFDFVDSNSFFEIDESSKKDGIVRISYIGPNVLLTGQDEFILSAVSKSDPAKTFGAPLPITIVVPVVAVPDEVSIQSDKQTASLRIKSSSDLPSNLRENLHVEWREKGPEELTTAGEIDWESKRGEGTLEIAAGSHRKAPLVRTLVLSHGEHELKSIRIAAAAMVVGEQDSVPGGVGSIEKNLLPILVEFEAKNVKLYPGNWSARIKYSLTPEPTEEFNLNFRSSDKNLLTVEPDPSQRIVVVSTSAAGIDGLRRGSSKRVQIEPLIGLQHSGNSFGVEVAHPMFKFEDDDTPVKLPSEERTKEVRFKLLPEDFEIGLNKFKLLLNGEAAAYVEKPIIPNQSSSSVIEFKRNSLGLTPGTRTKHGRATVELAGILVGGFDVEVIAPERPQPTPDPPSGRREIKSGQLLFEVSNVNPRIGEEVIVTLSATNTATSNRKGTLSMSVLGLHSAPITAHGTIADKRFEGAENDQTDADVLIAGQKADVDFPIWNKESSEPAEYAHFTVSPNRDVSNEAETMSWSNNAEIYCDKWPAAEEGQIQCTLTFRKTGEANIYARASFVSDSTKRAENWTAYPGLTDEEKREGPQGLPCEVIVITVRE